MIKNKNKNNYQYEMLHSNFVNFEIIIFKNYDKLLNKT